MGIVFAEPLLDKFDGPGLIRETAGQVLTDVEGEGGAPDFEPAELACLGTALPRPTPAAPAIPWSGLPHSMNPIG